MITALILLWAVTRPHQHTEILSRPAAITTLGMLTIAESFMAGASYHVLVAGYTAIYGSGILTGYYPDPNAAWIAFQDQSWDILALGQVTISACLSMAGSLALGEGRRQHLAGQSRAKVIAVGLANATAGWIAGTAMTTAAIAAQQNIAGYEMGVTITACAISTGTAGWLCIRAAKQWSNDPGGGTGRTVRVLKEQATDAVKALAKGKNPAEGRTG